MGLVLGGALFHAIWNLLIRRGRHPDVFVWLLGIAAAVVYVPLGVYRFSTIGLPSEGLPFVAATIAIHAVYFITLGRAYSRGDLSLVYPIARGIGPTLVPFLAVPFLGETISLVGGLGIAAVILGVVSLQAGGFGPGAARRFGASFRHPAAIYAVITGVLIAIYSTVDRAGVRYVDPVLYGYTIFLGAPALSGLYYVSRRRREIVECWQANGVSIVVAGALSPLSYFMALAAFRMGQVSYLAPLREVSIVFAAVLGVVVLRERFSPARLASAGITTAGVALIGFGA